MHFILMLTLIAFSPLASAVKWLPVGQNQVSNDTYQVDYDSINIATKEPTFWLRTIHATEKFDRVTNKTYYIDQTKFAFSCVSGNALQLARTQINKNNQTIWSASTPAHEHITPPPGSLIERVGKFACQIQKFGLDVPSLNWIQGQEKWEELKRSTDERKSYVSMNSIRHGDGIALIKIWIKTNPSPTSGSIPKASTNQSESIGHSISYSTLDCKSLSTYPLLAVLYDRKEKFTRLAFPNSIGEQPSLTENHGLFQKICAESGGAASKAEKRRQQIRSAEPELASVGSGFFINKEGYIATNHHVIKDCRSIKLRLPNKQIAAANLVASDPANDLAIIKSAVIHDSFATLRYGAARSGESIVAIGFPFAGLLAAEANISTGIVSATAGINNDHKNLQISAPVQSGNSGGPLLDKTGYVIGVVVAKLDAIQVLKLTGTIPENINFAVKADFLKLLLDGHKIDYSTWPWGFNKDVPDIAEKSKKFTVMIGCYQ